MELCVMSTCGWILIIWGEYIYSIWMDLMAAHANKYESRSITNITWFDRSVQRGVIGCLFPVSKSLSSYDCTLCLLSEFFFQTLDRLNDHHWVCCCYRYNGSVIFFLLIFEIATREQRCHDDHEVLNSSEFTFTRTTTTTIESSLISTQKCLTNQLNYISPWAATQKLSFKMNDKKKRKTNKTTTISTTWSHEAIA